MAAFAPSPAEASPQLDSAASDDEWDADGFVIPNLTNQDDDVTTHSVPKAMDPIPQQTTSRSFLPGVPHEISAKEKIYLGPHGAPPSQAKQQELIKVGRKQRFRNKLKEADRKSSGNVQENKVDSLRFLMGARTGNMDVAKSSRYDWLDPHCHESEFDRKPR